MANQQGWSQQTPAIKALLGAAVRAAPRKARTAAKRVKKAARRVKRAASKVKKVKARLKKGSAAAKAYMAKIRKLKK